jgi:hypothetical protein
VIRIVLVALLTVLVPQAASAQASQISVSGQVVGTDTGQPLRAASVSGPSGSTRTGRQRAIHRLGPCFRHGPDHHLQGRLSDADRLHRRRGGRLRQPERPALARRGHYRPSRRRVRRAAG